MITFKCSSCGHAYRVAEDYAGKKTHCKCGAVITVPVPEPTGGCGDSLARFNSLLLELLECEKRAPSV